MTDPQKFTPRTVREYPGRPELDRANRDFRRTVARLARDKDPVASAKASGIVLRAAAALDELAREAETARESSPFFRGPKMSRLEARTQASLRSIARAAAARGQDPDPRIARLLAEGFTRPKNGPHGDDAA